MSTTTNNILSDTQTAQFFSAPDATRQRQYEALRAYFLDNGAAADADHPAGTDAQVPDAQGAR